MSHHFLEDDKKQLSPRPILLAQASYWFREKCSVCAAHSHCMVFMHEKFSQLMVEPQISSHQRIHPPQISSSCKRHESRHNRLKRYVNRVTRDREQMGTANFSLDQMFHN